LYLDDLQKPLIVISACKRVLLGKPEGKNHWGDLGIDGWIILGWISRRWDVGI